MAPSNFLSFYYSFTLLNQRFFLYIIQVQVDPYLEDSMCDICRTTSGPFFCREESCFKYYCHSCWLWHHSIEGYRHHRSGLTRFLFLTMRHTDLVSIFDIQCQIVCQIPNSSVTVKQISHLIDPLYVEVLWCALWLACQTFNWLVGCLRLGWSLHFCVVFLGKKLCSTFSLFSRVCK